MDLDAICGSRSAGSKDEAIRQGGDHPTGKANFGGECGVSHCNQWGFCCVKLHEVIKLPFGVMSVVGTGIGLLDG